ncbi:MAG: ATP-binding protein [Saprospiraceae bacterium]
MHPTFPTTTISPVLAKAEILHSKAVVDAWLGDGEHLSRLLGLGVQISGCQYGYTALRFGAKILVGAQTGTSLSTPLVSGSFLEALEALDSDVDQLHFSGESVESFRQNPLLIAHPGITSVSAFALKDQEGVTIGCLVLASETMIELNEEQQTSCRVLARQLVQQLEFYQKVDDLKTSQEQLLQMNMELRRFASVAAHDLRSPLRAMGSFAGLLRRRLKQKLSAEELEYVDHIRSGATRLSAMVEGILNLAKANHEDYSNYENIDLPTVVAEVADLIDPDQHHIIDFEGDQRRMRSSLTAVKQVLMNLVSNAVKYHHLPAGKIIVSATKDEANYTIRVTDNGPGIAVDDQERIFEAFVTGKEAPRVPGTGLGLALVRSLSNRLGGSLSLESKVGEGSTFVVVLPVRFK